MALQNALGDIALDASVQEAVTQLEGLNAKVPALGDGDTLPDDNIDYLPVRHLPQKTARFGFDKVVAANGVDTAMMTLLQTGSGMAVSQSAGNLVITTGTTANAESVVRSLESFSGNLTVRASVTLSQRIANNNFYLELVDVIGDGLAYSITNATTVVVTIPNNPFTSANVGQFMYLGVIAGAAGIPGRFAIASVSGNNVTFTVAGWPASGSGTLSLFGWNYHHVYYTSTTATNANFDCQRNGWASGETTATINTTASGHVPTIGISDGKAGFLDQTSSSATTFELTLRATRVRNVPDDGVQLRLQIRAHNGTSNPASTTTFTVGFVAIDNFTLIPVSLNNISPQSFNSPLPCTITNTTTVNGTVTANIGTGSVAAGTNLIGDVGVGVRATTTNAASAYHVVAAASTNAASIKASAGRLYGWALSNPSAAWRYVKFHNTAGTPTAGTGVVRTIGIPPGGQVSLWLEAGHFFSTGIGVSIVTGSADNDANAVSLGDVVGEIFYA